jgi:hypothetical protein
MFATSPTRFPEDPFFHFKKTGQTTPDESDGAQLVQATQPFYSLHRKRFEFLHVERPQGEPWVVLQHATAICKMPLAWTDAAPTDPFVQPKSRRARRLLRSVDLLAVLQFFVS